MKLKITVHGVAYEVEVEVLEAGDGFPKAAPLPKRAAPLPSKSTPVTSTLPAPTPIKQDNSSGKSLSKNNSGAVDSPISGTVLEVKCKVGDAVKEGQVLMAIEAMKMETSIASPVSGKIKSIKVAVGDNVREGQLLVDFE